MLSFCYIITNELKSNSYAVLSHLPATKIFFEFLKRIFTILDQMHQDLYKKKCKNKIAKKKPLQFEVVMKQYQKTTLAIYIIQ